MQICRQNYDYIVIINKFQVFISFKKPHGGMGNMKIITKYKYMNVKREKKKLKKNKKYQSVHVHSQSGLHTK